MSDEKYSSYLLNLPTDLKEKWVKQPPVPFSNLADFLRTVAEMYDRGELVHSEESSGLDKDEYSDLIVFLEDMKDELIKEMKLTRVEIRANQSSEQERRERNREILKKNKIAQLKDIWINDPEITQNRTVKQLQSHIKYEYDHLQNVVFDVIDVLEQENYIQIKTNGRITWNKEML